MSQNDMSVANADGATVRGDINSALQALVSLSSGATAPTTTFAYQFWYDTANALLKIRNAANSAWVIIGPLADAAEHVIYTNNLPVVYVDSTGKVGIGINPSYELDVDGDINLTGGIYVNGVLYSSSFISLGTAGGTANALTATSAPTIAAYAAGQQFLIYVASTNTTTTPTLNVNALGAKTIKKYIGTTKVAVVAGDLVASTFAILAYDGTDIILMNPAASNKVNAIGSVGGGTQDIDLNLGRSVSMTIDTSTTTLTFSNPLPSGLEDIFTARITNGGSQTVNFPASLEGAAPGLTVSGVDELVFKTIDGGTTWTWSGKFDVTA